MNYFDASSRKRSREDEAFMAAEIARKNQGKVQQMFGQQPPINAIGATERPKGGGGGGDEVSKVRPEGPLTTTDQKPEFRSVSALSDPIPGVLPKEEFLLDGYGGGLDPCAFEYGWVEQLCLGWVPSCSSSSQGYEAGAEGVGGLHAQQHQDSDLGELGFWNDDIWQLWQIHEPPARRKEI